MRWSVAHSYFAFAALFLIAGAVSVVVERMGPPMVFAFSTLCSVFLVFGALEWKKSE